MTARVTMRRAAITGLRRGCPEIEMPPLEEIATFLTMALTMASSSDFVRSHVDPEGYAKGKAKESFKKEKQLAASGAELAIRKILSTPLTDLDIDKALKTIEEAEKENVLGSLIDKAAEHVEKALEVYYTEGAGRE